MRRNRPHAAHPARRIPARDQGQRHRALVDRHPRAAEIDVIGLEVLAKPGLVDVEVNEVVRVALAEQGSKRRDLEPIGGQDLHLRPAYAHPPGRGSRLVQSYP